MARLQGDAELLVRVSFEANRTAAQCLATAYERVAPVPCRAARAGQAFVIRRSHPDKAAEVDPPRQRTAERG